MRFLGVVLLSVLAGCASVDAAARQARISAAANWGHARDPETMCRELARVNAVGWDAQFFALTGEWRSEQARTDVLAAFGVLTESDLLAVYGAAGE